MASKNSKTNAELLYQLKQIQEGQNEILRTVSEIANTGLTSSMGTQLTANSSELNGKPSLTRVLFSDKSIEIFNPIIDHELKLFLCDLFTKMEIALKNLKPMEASFQLYRLFERLSPLIINHIAELELEHLAEGDTSQTELTTLISKSFKKANQEDCWAQVYKNGEDYKLSSTEPAMLEFTNNNQPFESKCKYLGETLDGAYIYTISKDDATFVFVDWNQYTKKIDFESKWLYISDGKFGIKEDSFKHLIGKTIVYKKNKMVKTKLLKLDDYNYSLGLTPLNTQNMTKYILETIIRLNPESNQTHESLAKSFDIVTQGRHDYAHTNYARTNFENEYTNDETFHSISQLSGYIKTFMVLYIPI
jgi:hypothetical protein